MTLTPTTGAPDRAISHDRRELAGAGHGVGPKAAVDIVVPVYNAPDDLARCIQSVLQCTTGSYRLVVIDDASPDPAIGTMLDELATRALPQVLILRNPTNLGFIGTANRGMQLSRADVVLLNSDTVVTNGWLDALQRCAASNPSFGTITPFSNNAEICSFPRFCEDNPWPQERDPESVRAALARAAVPTYPDLPTAVGFCMYVRRTLIDAIGVFDTAFGRGYGEENDFCLRGFAVGYRNVLCDDAFVLHLGGRSFLGQKAELGPRNLALLLARHPHYVRMVQGYIAADPLRPIREAALVSLRAGAGERKGVLHVIHHHGGGTEQHVRSLIGASRGDYRHYLAIAVGERWQIEEHLDDGAIRSFELARAEDESWPRFLEGLCATLAVGMIHVHNLSACREGLLAALAQSPVPYGFTVHDVFLGCPTTTFLGRDGLFCGGQNDPQVCGECLRSNAGLAGVDIVQWRERHAAFVADAAFVIAPSRWAAALLRRYFTVDAIEIIPHAMQPVSADAANRADSTASRHVRLAALLPRDGVPTVAVLGAIGPDKGARRTERMVEEARRRGARIRFVVIGYFDSEPGPWQSQDTLLTVHGSYERGDVPDLLAHYRAELVVFPSAGPESFSFTLSEAWAAGYPVLVPPIGALAERVADTGAGWIWTTEEWRSESRMLDAILSKVGPPERGHLQDAAKCARDIALPSLTEMVARTTKLYERFAASRGAIERLHPIAPIRVRDALGYRLWYPQESSAPPPRSLADESAQEQISEAREHWAIRLRRTWIGRRLRNIAPRPLRHAFRARLK